MNSDIEGIVEIGIIFKFYYTENELWYGVLLQGDEVLTWTDDEYSSRMLFYIVDEFNKHIELGLVKLTQ